ncbi:MAG: carbohydrate binding domain-containing protein [Bacteroidaceae bacterium]|nr:carbohydrate binding domain-containing protein [Bacteroidaceae bacterium]
MQSKLSLFCLFSLLCALTGRAQSSFEFSTSQRGPLLSPLQYGIFYEEINHGGDGGLYAELIRNRSFEDNASSAEGWQGVGSASLSVFSTKLLNTAQAHALKLTINQAEAGVRNEGFWGMNFVEGETYTLTFWARTDGTYEGRMCAELQDGDKHSLGSTEFEVSLSDDWQKYTLQLTATGSATKGWLALKGLEPMVIYLDVVSLMPPTFKDRPNGCRRDLAEMLYELHPTFVRFPGGCYIEGTWRDGLTNRFEWKKTIGPIEERPGHWNVNWGYRVSDGLGLHELLQLTEDLGAEPLFVCNIGVGHGWMQNYQDLNGFIQEALDLIEYCNGDVTTTYGALRAANGHPEPFGLRLLEIGNENYNYSFGNNNDQSDHYAERYRMFYDAIKAKYPNMILIGNVESWGTDDPSWRNGNPVDAVDEHYYRSTVWFTLQYNKYDGFNRDAHRVYAGEYAVTTHFGNVGNLNAALAEAIYMAGMERNSDVCFMASYAPIFCHESHPSPWMPDMIRFNAAASFGTPSYWVQQMMASDVGWQNITWKEQGNDLYGTNRAIALSSWSTSVSYDNIRVSDVQGNTLYATDFSDAEEYQQHWSATGGSWDINGGRLNQTSSTMQGECNVCRIQCSVDYTLELDATKQSGNEGFLVVFNYEDPDNFIWWNLGGWTNSQHAIEQCIGGSKRTLTTLGGSLTSGKTYHLRIDKRGNDVYCYVDNTLYHHITLKEAHRIYACAALNQTEDTLIVKLVNMGQEERTTLRFKDFRWTGQVVQKVLTSTNGADENSMTERNKVTPVTWIIDNGQQTTDYNPSMFDVTCPAHSLSILRIPVEHVTPEWKTEPAEDDWRDVTEMLFNPNFAEGKDGWSGTPFLAAPGTVAEFYNQNFDAYQILTNMPAGYYRFTINGFYRNGSIQNAWTAHTGGTEQLNALLYIEADGQTVQTPFMSIFDSSAPFTYSPDYTYPDNVTQANLSFNIKGAYQDNAVETKLTTEGGELRVGMKKTVATSYDWNCFDNARLYYRKDVDTDGIGEVKNERVKSEKYDNAVYDLTGRKIDSSLNTHHSLLKKKGIYIVNGEKVVVK